MRQAANTKPVRTRKGDMRMVRRRAMYFVALAALGWALPARAQMPATGASQQAMSALARINAQARAMLNKTLQALGGPAFANFKTMTSQGRIFAISEGDTTGFAPFESKVEYPDKRRFTYGKSQSVALINNGDRGWELDRYGLIRQTPERTRRWQIANRYSLENLLRVVVGEPGTLVQDAGVDFVDLLPVTVLEIVDQRGVDVKLYLQRSTYLPVRIAYRTRERPDEDWTENEEAYSDYRLIEGVQTPLHLTRYENGSRVLEVFRASARYNEDYPPGTFEPQ